MLAGGAGEKNLLKLVSKERSCNPLIDTGKGENSYKVAQILALIPFI